MVYKEAGGRYGGSCPGRGRVDGRCQRGEKLLNAGNWVQRTKTGGKGARKGTFRLMDARRKGER